ncbi:MAG: hypothetical protein JWN90_226 [Parcubacteria group bacterium]|nr:hypothetical protein [Parcubacteria group bacterium]
MKLTHITHALLTIVVLIIAFSAYGIWYTTVSRKSAQAASLAVEIQTKHQDSQRIQAAKDELQKISSDESLVNGYFVSTNDVVPFLETLQSTGKKLGSEVQVVSVSADPGKPHAHLNLSLSITGPFDSVVRTLGALEYSPYDASLQSLTLDTPQTGTGKAVQWTAAATFFIGTTNSPQTPVVAPTAAAVPVATTTTKASSATTTAAKTATSTL